MYLFVPLDEEISSPFFTYLKVKEFSKIQFFFSVLNVSINV